MFYTDTEVYVGMNKTQPHILYFLNSTVKKINQLLTFNS